MQNLTIKILHMDALIKEVSERAGITIDQAKNAVLIVSDKLKAKFPQAMHEEIDAVFNGGNFGDAFKSKMKGAGDKAEDMAKTFAKKADEMFTEVGERMREFFKQDVK
jgi:hypothetical protein